MTLLLGESTSLSTAVIVTVPALVVAPAAMVSSLLVLRLKSPDTAGETAAAETVSVTSWLDSALSVAVTVAGVDTLDRERDETLLDPEFFDGASFPLVHYRAKAFSVGAEDGVFIADGAIEVKGSTTPAELRFTVERSADRVLLRGRTTLDRLALKVGTGEWEDTAWIGQHVDVDVRVEATVQ